MKIKDEYPPNIEDIKKVFTNLEKHKPIFCYSDTIYNPFKVNVTPDLHVHEGVHQRQQGDYPDVWWYKYLTDMSFRLDQEIEAYGEQLKFVKDNGVRGKLFDWIKDKIAMSLSSDLYGNIISYAKAESAVRNYAK